MRFYANLASVVVVAFLGWSFYVIWFGGPEDAFADCRQGAAGGEIGGPFSLIDQTGATVTEAEALSKPALIYFGYTSCPDICPLDNARNAEAVDILEEQGFEVTPVFITIDPARDTLPVMAEYAANFHPRMLALTGSDDQIAAAARAFRVYYKKQDSGDEYYLMDHSVFTYLMLPGTGFADFFKRDMAAQDLARSVGCYLQAR